MKGKRFTDARINYALRPSEAHAVARHAAIVAGTGYGWHPPTLRWPVDEAFRWLCASRKHFPDNADAWPLRSRWQAERKRLLRQLRSGSYRVEPVRRCDTADGKVIHLWSARDALVLKGLSLLLARPLGVSCHRNSSFKCFEKRTNVIWHHRSKPGVYKTGSSPKQDKGEWW
jgi:hypothetical protein